MSRSNADATAASSRFVPRSLSRLRFWFIIVTSSVGIYFFYTINSNTNFLPNDEQFKSGWNYHRYLNLDNESTYTIETEGCSIPKLKVFDESIIQYVGMPDTLRPCENENTTMLKNNDTHIWIDKLNPQFRLFSKGKHGIRCCYRSFYRPSSIKYIQSRNIDRRVKYRRCIYFDDTIEVQHEFVTVSCSSPKAEGIVTQYYVFARKKPNQDSDYNFSNDTFNVIILGIDGVSRLNVHRTMPKTITVLNKLKAIELLGYNKVGDNTFPNLIPMLMGVKDSDLRTTCLPNSKSTFDNCPFVWEWYKQAGYYTALAEDSSSLGTFNFGHVGFTGTPVHYYLHTFIEEAERVLGNNKDFNSFLCMREKYFYKLLLDYILSLSKTLIDSKLFGLFWEITMSHDHLNYPMVMDDDYENFFNKLNRSGYLNKTVLFFLSDHGIRWGKIRLTKQGRLEERLPFAYVLLPPAFRDRYPRAYRNMKLNQKRLTTPFDIHATLMSLLDPSSIEDESIIKNEEKAYASNNSINLFFPVPGNRTCKTAGIAIHWCTCLRGVSVPVMAGTSLEAGAALVNKLNRLLRGEKACAHLRLASVVKATELQTSGQSTPDDWREYELIVRTIPGDGIFEATMRHSGAKWSLSGTVSRLNQYGDQSRCINQNQLKLYCYCL